MLPQNSRIQTALRALVFVFSSALIAQAATPGVRIDAGDNTAHTDSSGNVWAADSGFAGGTVPAQSGNAINIAGVTNPAPLATYQTERYGPFTYTVPGLTAGAAYSVRLHFAEVYFNAANLRKFNVSINGTRVLTEFDIFATAGGINKAVAQQFAATANAAGQVVIQFTAGTVNNPKVCGIEVLGNTAPVNANGVAVDCGGPVAGTFVADTYFAGGTAANHANAVSTAGLTNPAPLAVYQNERWGASTYTIPALNPSTAYKVRLHFAETYFTGAAGQGAAGTGLRQFNVSINGAAVLTNFDVTAAAGGANKAVIKEFVVSSNAAGQITVQLTAGLKDNPEINGIEVVTNIAIPAPVITSPTTATGAVGTAFSYQIVATNAPTGFGAANLPAGLTVNTATGLISGTPTASGTKSVTLSASNSGGTGTGSLALSITGLAPVINSPATATGTVGTAFSYQITAANNPTSFGATGLPAGLAVNAATGLISGTPSAAATSNVTLTATNAVGSDTAPLSVTISNVGLFPAGKAISQQLVGQNDWYGLPAGPALIWNVIADSSIGVMRIGGHEYDVNPFDNATLLAHVQRIRDAGAEPLIQVSRFAGAARAADMVNYINVVNHMNVTLWSIGNEPDLNYGGGDAALAAMVAGYTKAIAPGMRDKDPSIKIFATEYAWYGAAKCGPLLSGNNDANDISGKDGKGRYYIDGIIFHRYPFANNISRAQVIDEAHNAFPGVVGQLLGQLATANQKQGRTGANALGWGMGEFNVSYNNPQPNNKDGMGTVSFINGQLFAEYFRVGMANGATTMDTWSVNEGGGNGSGGDLGYVGGSQAAPTKRSSYYHMQMVGDYLIPGGYLAGRSSNGNVGVIASSINNRSQVAVMLLNEETAVQSFTVRLDDAAVSGAAQTKINVSAAHASEYSGSIGGQTTLILVFDGAGTLKKRVTYSLTRYQADQAPLVENF